MIRFDPVRRLLNFHFWFPLGVRWLDSPSETCLSAAVEPIMYRLSSYLAPLVSLVPGLVFETADASRTHLMTCFHVVSLLFFQKLWRDHTCHEIVLHVGFSAKSGSYLLLHCRCLFCTQIPILMAPLLVTRTLIRLKASTYGEGPWFLLVLTLLKLLFLVLKAQFGKPHQMGWLSGQDRYCFFLWTLRLLLELISDSTVLKALLTDFLRHYFQLLILLLVTCWPYMLRPRIESLELREEIVHFVSFKRWDTLAHAWTAQVSIHRTHCLSVTLIKSMLFWVFPRFVCSSNIKCQFCFHSSKVLILYSFYSLLSAYVQILCNWATLRNILRAMADLSVLFGFISVVCPNVILHLHDLSIKSAHI